MRAADNLDQAVDHAVMALRHGSERDWEVPAGPLEWSCWDTAEHAAHCMRAYGIQLASQAPTHYVSYDSHTEDGATTADLLELIEASGRLLSAVVRAAKPTDRGFHPFGMADAEGTAGMGCIELVVHGSDVAAGLGLRFEPPSDVCAWLLARMFPDRHAELTSAATDIDAWAGLRWATGRISIPGLPTVPDRWRWHCAPLADRSL